MRDKLKNIGEGMQITVLGKYQKRKSDRYLLLDVYKLRGYYVEEFLAEHMWVKIVKDVSDRRTDTFVIITGTVYQYVRSNGTVDYSLKDCIVKGVIQECFYKESRYFMRNPFQRWRYSANLNKIWDPYYKVVEDKLMVVDAQANDFRTYKLYNDIRECIKDVIMF